MWECEFDESGIVEQKPELLVHPIGETLLYRLEMLYTGVEPRLCVFITRHAMMKQ
jgi:hypothetical protein